MTSHSTALQEKKSSHGFLVLMFFCFLLLPACSSSQTVRQYSTIRYHDALTTFRTPAMPRERLVYEARQTAATANLTIDSSTNRTNFVPVPSEELDDGDIEYSPDMEKEPSVYPRLGLLKPMANIQLASAFGMRRHPIKHRVLMHAGVDIAGQRGEKVIASAPGKVVYSGRKGSYGLTVDIDAGHGMLLRYAHLDKLGVREGQKVRQGQYIGNLGITGRVTGPHLHFEVRLNDRPINPMKFITPEHRWANNAPSTKGRNPKKL